MKRKIISYNVNGIRAAVKKGLLDFFDATDADVICLQETKARESDLDESVTRFKDYHVAWHSAEKKGYSGVAIFSKEKPLRVVEGSGMDLYDREGRFLRFDFEAYSVVSLYIPSGSSGDERQAFKDQFLLDFLQYAKELKAEVPKLLISGDYNICHKDIDIHNPVSNKKSSGFLPHEREWVSTFLDAGFVDTFRQFNPDPDHYTWWSFRAQARMKNKGWRIDYHMATEALAKHCVDHVIHSDAVHSDHCPIELVLDI